MPTTAWTVCDDGKLYNVSTTSVLATVDIKATESWLTAANLFMVAPGPTGSVVVLTGLGVETDRRWVLPRVAWAVASGTRVYCFDGMGKGRTITIRAAGKITVGETFVAPQCVNIVDAIVDTAILYVATTTRDLIISFALTDLDAPAFSTKNTTYVGKGVTGIASATRPTTKTDVGLFYDGDRWMSLFGGRLAGTNYYAVANAAMLTDD